MLLLLITAAIWGFAFVAQRMGMESLDPFSYNAIRFAMGAIFVWMVLLRKRKVGSKAPWLMGIVLFVAASFQQVGIVYTGAGSAGFITGLYVVMVPLLGVLRRQKPGRSSYLAIALAVCGLYFINRPESLQASLGNLLVLISAGFFAWHVQLVDYYTGKYDTGALAFMQFAICSVLSLASAFVWHGVEAPMYFMGSGFADGVRQAILPLLYGGLLSVGIAYTLQIKAQQRTEPTKAAIVLCSEGVFALLGGWLILGEEIGIRTLIGAVLILAAMLLSSLAKHFD